MSKRALKEAETETRARAQTQFIWWGELVPELQAKIVRHMVTNAGDDAVDAFSRTSHEWRNAIQKTLADEFNALLDRHAEETKMGSAGEPLKRNYLLEVADFIRSSGISADYLYHHVMRGQRSDDFDDDDRLQVQNDLQRAYPHTPVSERPLTIWDNAVRFARPREQPYATVEDDIIRLESRIAGSSQRPWIQLELGYQDEVDRARANAFIHRLSRQSLGSYIDCNIPANAPEVFDMVRKFYLCNLERNDGTYLPRAVITAIMRLEGVGKRLDTFLRSAFPNVQSVAHCHLDMAYGGNDISPAVRAAWEELNATMWENTAPDRRIFLTLLPALQVLLAGHDNARELICIINAWIFLVGNLLTMDERAGVLCILRERLVETHDLALFIGVWKIIGKLFPLDELMSFLQSLPLSLVDACPALIIDLMARGKKIGLESFSLAVWRWRSTADGTESEPLFDLQRNNQRLLTYLLWETAACEDGPEIVADAAITTLGPFPALPSAPLDRVMDIVAVDDPERMVKRLFFYLHRASEYDFWRVITCMNVNMDSIGEDWRLPEMVQLFQQLAEAGHESTLVSLLDVLTERSSFRSAIYTGIEMAKRGKY